MKGNFLSTAVKTSLISFAMICIIGLVTVFVILPREIKGKSVEVPNVLNRPLSEAESILHTYGLNPVVDIRRFSNTVAENHIIAQSPQAGMKIKLGGKVGLVVSLGRDKVSVPDLVGKSIDDAESIIGEIGLRVGTRSRTYSDQPSGVVIAQVPRARNIIPRGDPVDLLISDGRYPEPMIMKDLSGLDRQEVETMIRNSGLVIGDVTFQESGELEAGTVIAHDPPPGSTVVAGQKVDLIVSAKQVRRELRSRPVVVEYTVSPESDTRPVHVRIVVEHERGIERIVDGEFMPGEKIERLTFVTGEAMVRIYEMDMTAPIKEEIIR